VFLILIGFKLVFVVVVGVVIVGGVSVVVFIGLLLDVV